MNMDSAADTTGRMATSTEHKKFIALLDAYREAAGLSDAALSKKAGISEDYVNKLRRRKSLPKAEFIAKLARALQIEPTALFPGASMPSAFPKRPRIQSVTSIPVKCVAKAGYWAEPELLQDAQENNEYGQFISIPPRPGYDVESQYAVRIDGNSINKIALSGAYAICVRLNAFPGGEELERLHGRFVHVERQRGGLIENTIKKFVIENGAAALWPHSNDRRHQTPVPLGNGDDDTVSILGIVLGFYSDAPAP